MVNKKQSKKERHNLMLVLLSKRKLVEDCTSTSKKMQSQEIEKKS